MGSISDIVYYAIDCHCAKFVAFTTKCTIISPFCRTLIGVGNGGRVVSMVQTDLRVRVRQELAWLLAKLNSQITA